MPKTYSNKSNATRAARKAGLDVDTLSFVQVLDGTWTYEAKPAAPAPLARPYRIVRRNPVREAARATAKTAALEAAAKAQAQATASVPAPKAAQAGETPRHKEFAVYGQSVILSPVKFVHKFLDANGKTLSRKDALFQLAKAGVNTHTARTQYQRWFAANK